jgi:hypothetical protein
MPLESVKALDPNELSPDPVLTPYRIGPKLIAQCIEEVRQQILRA